MLKAYITNLGKYNEGELVGEYLAFPATTEEVQALLAWIGVDGKRYEELFITDYESDIAGLTENLGEYESIDELNYLAALLEELDDRGELSKFEAALELGDYCGSVQELINLTQNLDDYDFYPDIADEEDLGRYYVDDLDALQIPESIEQYFDYEAYGRDIVLNSSCTFASSGFITNDGGRFIEYYAGIDEIPDEYRVFAYPERKEERSILKALKQYREAPAAEQGDRDIAMDSHTER